MSKNVLLYFAQIGDLWPIDVSVNYSKKKIVSGILLYCEFELSDWLKHFERLNSAQYKISLIIFVNVAYLLRYKSKISQNLMFNKYQERSQVQ